MDAACDWSSARSGYPDGQIVLSVAAEGKTVQKDLQRGILSDVLGAWRNDHGGFACKGVTTFGCGEDLLGMVNVKYSSVKSMRNAPVSGKALWARENGSLWAGSWNQRR